LTNSGIDWNDMLSLPKTCEPKGQFKITQQVWSMHALFLVCRQRAPVVDRLYPGDHWFWCNSIEPGRRQSDFLPWLQVHHLSQLFTREWMMWESEQKYLVLPKSCTVLENVPNISQSWFWLVNRLCVWYWTHQVVGCGDQGPAATSQRASKISYDTTPQVWSLTSTIFPSGNAVGSRSNSTTIRLINVENLRGGILSRLRWFGI
jgi:hypothetical protein